MLGSPTAKASDTNALLGRGFALAARLGLDTAELAAIKAGPHHAYLVLIPFLERLAERLEALEKTETG